MIINSDEGVFLQSINLADMKCFSTVPRVKNITSDYICFFKDGDRFIAGCEQNLLVESRLSKYTSQDKYLRQRRLEGTRITRIKLNRDESQVFVCTKTSIYQLSVDDLDQELHTYRNDNYESI